MREAGEPSTTRRVCCIVLCPSHRRWAWSHHRRSCATQRWRKSKGHNRNGVTKAKAALVDDGPVQRGQQYRHYKAVAPAPSNNLPPRWWQLHGLSRWGRAKATLHGGMREERS
jgi:hypothetical protein